MFPELFKALPLRKKTVTVINIVFFTIFLLIIIYNLNKAPAQLLLIGVLVFAGGLYFLYLKYLSELLEWQFYEKLQIAEAEKTASLLQKYDRMNSYQREISLYRIDSLLYQNKGKDALELIEKNLITDKKEVLLRKLKAYLLRREDEQLLDTYYQAADEVSDDQIRGIFYRGKKDLKMAYECFERIDRSKLNTYDKKFVLDNLIFCADRRQKDIYRNELQEMIKE